MNSKRTTALSPDSIFRNPVSNNTWLRRCEANTVIVFVHGLFSTADECWRTKDGVYWPTLVSEDESFANCSIFLAGYEASVSAGNYGIDQCARELHASLKVKIDALPSVLEFPRMVFVCHSLGGIVIRRVLEEFRESFRAKAVDLVLMASPTLGSGYASSLRKVAKLYGHKIGKALAERSGTLVDLDNRFRDLLKRNEFLRLQGAEAIEHHGPIAFKWLPIRLKPIVVEESGSRYFGSTRLLPNTDHSTIVKPGDFDHPSHKFLRAYYQEHVLPHLVVTETQENAGNKTNLAPDPLFDIYKPVHAAMYVDRAIDSSLDNALGVNSVWLSGHAGVGKTSVAKRWINKNAARPVEISLAHLSDVDVRNQLCSEILESVSDSEISSGNAFKSAVNEISKRGKGSVVPLFIDEVPLRSATLCAEVPQIVGQLLDSVNRQDDQREIRFLVCSVNQPDPLSIDSKMRSRFSFMNLKPWTDPELQQLIDVIQDNGEYERVSSTVRNQIVSLSKGSPRFVKTFFRRYWAGGAKLDSINQCLLEAKHTQQV